jgi:hypothetical protein
MAVTLEDVRALASRLPRSYEKFVRPEPADLRYQWLVVRLDAIDENEMRELVLDAWRMVVPKKLAALSDDELVRGAAEPS